MWPRLAVLLQLSLVMARPLQACTCEDMKWTGQMALQEHAIVFVGTATDVKPPYLEFQNGVPRRAVTLVTFHIQKSWKGVADSTITVRTGAGGGDCSYEFKPGRQYAVFATLWNHNPRTTICTPTETS